jgi:NhaP-type Na+/H+ or K+/H+ antiporter
MASAEILQKSFLFGGEQHMAISLALIITLGMLANFLFEKIKLPGLLGMLLVGIAIGPYGLNLMEPEIMAVSADLRKIALIVILLRAGLGLKKETLQKVGKNAIRMSFIPCLLEGFTIMYFAHLFFGISFAEAGILGFTLAAVSPAVIVPSMLQLIDSGKGSEKGLPTMILAGASVDDVFAITFFSSMISMYFSQNISIGNQLIRIPISIFFGILLGYLVGTFFTYLFQKIHMRDTKKTLLLLGAAVFMTGFEDFLADKIEIAALLGVMTVGFILLEKYPKISKRLSVKLNKIWVFAEIILFVLVGAQVNISVASQSLGIGLLLILLGLIARSIGVLLSISGSDYTPGEKLFCVVAYWPKATVQAAIGSVPLTMGVAHGESFLAIAVLAILVTAPLGAIGIRIIGEKVLQ